MTILSKKNEKKNDEEFARGTCLPSHRTHFLAVTVVRLQNTVRKKHREAEETRNWRLSEPLLGEGRWRVASERQRLAVKATFHRVCTKFGQRRQKRLHGCISCTAAFG